MSYACGPKRLCIKFITSKPWLPEGSQKGGIMRSDFQDKIHNKYGREVCERTDALQPQKGWNLEDIAKFIFYWEQTTALLRNSRTDLSKIRLAGERSKIWT